MERHLKLSCRLKRLQKHTTQSSNYVVHTYSQEISNLVSHPFSDLACEELPGTRESQISSPVLLISQSLESLFETYEQR